MEPQNEQTRRVVVDVSIRAILKIIIAAFALSFLFVIRDVLVILFVALVLASIIDPIATFGGRFHIPRAISVVATYVVILFFLTLGFTLIIPPLLTELGGFTGSIVGYWSRLVSRIATVRELSVQYGLLENFQRSLVELEGALGRAAGSVFTTVTGIFGGIISLIATFVVTFYLVVEKDALKKLFQALAPERHQQHFSTMLSEIQRKIGRWLRGQIFLSFLVGFLVYAGLLALRVDYALVLALFAGITEFVPYLGPLIGAVPAILIALTISPMTAGLTALLYLLIQQLENAVFVPRIMARAVGLNPVVTVVALLIGGRVAGIAGILLAIPIVTGISVVLEDVYRRRALV